MRDELSSVDAVVIGCGFGTHEHSGKFVREFVTAEELAGVSGVVVDADGLNLLAARRSVGVGAKASAPLILTPHPGEMGRLTDSQSTDEVQGQRLTLARDCASAWNCQVVLKGANTVVAGPDARARVSEVAQPALSTAGTGDVLSGAIGALLAQGLAPFDAATLGVYLHGDAGNRAAKSRGNDWRHGGGRRGSDRAGGEVTVGRGAGRGALAGRLRRRRHGRSGSGLAGRRRGRRVGGLLGGTAVMDR